MKQRPDGRWEKVKTVNGHKKHFYSTAATEKAAEKDIEKQFLLACNKKFFDVHNFKSLGEKLLEHHESSISYNTVESYRHTFKHLYPLYDMNIEEITPALVQKLLDDMAKDGNSFSGVSKVKTLTGLIFDYAIVHEGLPITNFMRSVKIPKFTHKGKIKAPDDVVIDEIVKNADTASFGLWALSLLCTGYRQGELNALRVWDVDFEKDLIFLKNSTVFINNQPVLKSTKTNEDVRITPILDLYRPYLKKLCEGKAKEEFVFGGEKPFTKIQIRKRWDKYCKEIGHNFNGHQLRHAYAKLLYRAGIDPKTMQHLLGHADFKTTMNIYTEFANEVTEKAINRINDFVSSAF